MTSDKQDLYKIDLKHNQSYPIQLRTSFTNTPLQQQQEHAVAEDYHPAQDQLMKFKLDFNTACQNAVWQPHTITVSSSATNAFPLTPTNQLLLCETTTILDKRRIRLRSPIQVINTLEFDVLVSYPCAINESASGKDAFSSASVHWADDVIRSGKKWCLPLTTLQQNKVDFFRICPLPADAEQSSKTPEMQIINWHSTALHKLLSFNMNKLFIQVLIEKEPVNVYSNDQQDIIDMSYNIVLLPTVTFNNYLPYTVRFKVDSSAEVENRRLHAGESVRLYTAKIGASHLLLELADYAGATWYSSHLIEFSSRSGSEAKGREEETSTIEFRSHGKLVTLCYSSVLENNCLTFSLYAPYWVINQTKLKLDYKVSFKMCLGFIFLVAVLYSGVSKKHMINFVFHAV